MEFEEAQTVFSSLLQVGKMPKKMEQKLQLLEHCIVQGTQPQDTSVYDQLLEDECQSLIKLNQKALQDMFCQIVQSLAGVWLFMHAQSSFVPCSHDQTIQGEIDIQTKTLKKWKAKKFLIDVRLKQFEIVRKSKKSKKERRMVQLQYYLLQAKDFRDKRYRFCLTAAAGEKHGYYKQLVCGSTDKQLCDKVMDVIKTLCQFNNQVNKSSMIMRNNESICVSYDDERQQKQSNQFAQSQIISPQQYAAVPVGRMSQMPLNNDVKLVETKKIEQPIKVQQQVIQVQQQQLSPTPLIATPTQSQIQPKSPQQQSKPQITQPTQLIQQQIPITIPTTTTTTTTPIQTTTTLTPIPPPLQQEPTQLLQQSSETTIPLMKQASDVPEQYPVLFQQLIDDGKLHADYFQQSSKNFTQIQEKDGIQLLKSQSSQLCFRSYLNVPNDIAIEKVFQSLAEIEFTKKWNAVINPQDSKFLSVIGGENSGIVYQKHKQYGMLYLPRDYVYLRHVSQRDNVWMIVDKSIEHEDAPQQLKVIRGEINYQIIEIRMLDNSISIHIESEITNGGLSSTGQDCAMTQWYLQELRNLTHFLKTYSTSPTIQSPLLSALQTKAVVYEVQQPLDTPVQQLQDIEILEKSALDLMPTVCQEPMAIPVIEQQIDEIQHYNEEIDDDILVKSNFTPDEVVLNTLPNLTEDEMTKLRRLINAVEEYRHYQFYLTHKFQNEPIPAKEDLITEIDGGHYFLRQDWERDNKSGGMIFKNAKKIEAQKRVIKFMLKTIGSNLLSGKSILNISLPVEIFETRSNLERFAYAFGFGPKYLEDGAKAKTPAEQMKHTLTFGMSLIIVYMSLEKPFNPILGETYQGIINGCPIYAEQISHHPPIASFQFKGRGYEVDGHLESTASMHANSVTGKNVGYLRVTYYNTGAKQMFSQCPGSLSGTAFGTRMFNLTGKSFGVDIDNKLIAELAFNPGKSAFNGRKDITQDMYIGGIYRVKDQGINKFRKEGYLKFNGIDTNKDVEEKLHHIQGVWCDHMEIDGQRTFNLEMLPHKMSNYPNPLPSDCNYRLDILWWKLKEFDKSQSTKEALEVKQRNDRKCREKVTGKKH